jgi:hypothetical protein
MWWRNDLGSACLMDWIVYYADGSTFSSQDGEPWDAPRRYVQLVMQRHPAKGAVILHGSCNDYIYYCWHGDQWRPHTQVGFEQYLDAPGSVKVRLCGYWIEDEKFSAVINRALNHPEFAGKVVFEPCL